MEKLYTTKATATGGRNGHVKSHDGLIDADVRTPKEAGGPDGAYLNPETFFAAGYASCFDGALNLVARLNKIRTGITHTTAHVTFGKEGDGYGLAVTLEVEVPDVDRATAEDLVQKAHQVCPYSKATRGNIEVTLVVK